MYSYYSGIVNSPLSTLSLVLMWQLILFSLMILMSLSVLGYILILARAYWGIVSVKAGNTTMSKASVSLIIPFRNEEENLPALLNSLSSQNYDKDFLNVYLVNDHSEDDSSKIVSDHISHADMHSYHLINLPQGRQGKKAAIEEAIKRSKSEFILTSDADCIHGSNWISTMVSVLKNSDLDMLCGPVALIGSNDFFSKVQRMEYRFMQNAAAGLMNAGHPLLCSGANLIYKRSVFIELGGFSGNRNILSGDDTFLMFKFWNKRKGSVMYTDLSDTIVQSNTVKSFSDYASQRLRWTSKVWYYKSTFVKTTGLITGLAHLTVPAGILLLLFSNYFPILAVFIVLKILADIVFWYLSNDRDRDVKFYDLLLFELLYPLILILLLLFSMKGNSHWKGRSLKNAYAES